MPLQLHQMHNPALVTAALLLAGEATGVVLGMKGKDVTHVKEGDRVMAHLGCRATVT